MCFLNSRVWINYWFGDSLLFILNVNKKIISILQRTVKSQVTEGHKKDVKYGEENLEKEIKHRGVM